MPAYIIECTTKEKGEGGGIGKAGITPRASDNQLQTSG